MTKRLATLVGIPFGIAIGSALGIVLVAGGLPTWQTRRLPVYPPERPGISVPSPAPIAGRPIAGRLPVASVPTVHLLAVGDMMMAGPMGHVMQQHGRDYPFVALKPTLRSADLVFGNLECCIATCGKPIPKQFNFQAHPRAALALNEAGFTIVSLANNHAWDYGRDALAETVRRVRSAGVQTVGAGRNRAEAHQLQIVTRNGLRVGFLAYLGLIPALVPETEGAPSLSMGSTAAIRDEVKAARGKVDVLIVSLHAGQEMQAKITPRQRAFAQAAIEAGADLVIGHHPHVTQAMEIYRGKPICYSLGNFVFSTTGRGSGAMLQATLQPGKVLTPRLLPLNLSDGRPRFLSRSPQGRATLWTTATAATGLRRP